MRDFDGRIFRIRPPREQVSGTIDNDPELVHNVKIGQKMTVDSSQVADWLYMKAGKMYGNFTVRVLLPKMAPEDQAKIRALMAPE